MNLEAKDNQTPTYDGALSGAEIKPGPGVGRPG
jgi:hypothetical protein